MRRPMLFWHNHKRVTTVLTEVKSWENSEGLKIPRCVSKAVILGPHCPACGNAMTPCPHRPFTTSTRGEKQGSEVRSSLSPLQTWPAEAGRWAPEPCHHHRLTDRTCEGGGRQRRSTRAARVTSNIKVANTEPRECWLLPPARTHRLLRGPAAGPPSQPPASPVTFPSCFPLPH